MKVYDNPTSIMFQDFQPPAPSDILYLSQTLNTCERGLLRHFPNFLISQAQKNGAAQFQACLTYTNVRLCQ